MIVKLEPYVNGRVRSAHDGRWYDVANDKIIRVPKDGDRKLLFEPHFALLVLEKLARGEGTAGRDRETGGTATRVALSRADRIAWGIDESFESLAAVDVPGADGQERTEYRWSHEKAAGAAAGANSRATLDLATEVSGHVVTDAGVRHDVEDNRVTGPEGHELIGWPHYALLAFERQAQGRTLYAVRNGVRTFRVDLDTDDRLEWAISEEYSHIMGFYSEERDLPAFRLMR